jgi:hypothetical protein
MAGGEAGEDRLVESGRTAGVGTWVFVDASYITNPDACSMARDCAHLDLVLHSKILFFSPPLPNLLGFVLPNPASVRILRRSKR